VSSQRSAVADAIAVPVASSFVCHHKDLPLPMPLLFRCLLLYMSPHGDLLLPALFRCLCFAVEIPIYPENRHLDRSGSQSHREPRSGEIPAFPLCPCTCSCRCRPLFVLPQESAFAVAVAAAFAVAVASEIDAGLQSLCEYLIFTRQI
jgi:hypothetical protein